MAEKMSEKIMERIGADFANVTDASLQNLPVYQELLAPWRQKGGPNLDSFTCVGLIEWAAEAVSHNNGEGFIPNAMEAIPLPDSNARSVPVLSPQLLYWVLDGGYFEAANKLQNWLSGALDPVDFVLTDPLGRRLAFTAELGVINEIPGAQYSGDGDFEQFFIPNPIAGDYVLELVGLGEFAGAVFGDSRNGQLFTGQLDVRQTERLVYTVLALPEPSSVSLFLASTAGLTVSQVRRKRGVQLRTLEATSAHLVG